MSFSIPIELTESNGVDRVGQPVEIGIPFGIGQLSAQDSVSRCDGHKTIACQSRAVSYWPDKSVKWLLVDFVVDLPANSSETHHLVLSKPGADDPASAIAIETEGTRIGIDTGAARFELETAGPHLLLRAVGCSGSVPALSSARLVLTDSTDTRHFAVIQNMRVVAAGPIRVDAICAGTFNSKGRNIPLHFSARLSFFVGSGVCSIHIDVTNSRASRHRDNLWDLGDAGSFLIRELGLELELDQSLNKGSWAASPNRATSDCGGDGLLIYQDSSGGENWNSGNHIGASGRPTVEFRGFRATNTALDQQLEDGLRAEPRIVLRGDQAWLAVAMQKFWENFPKSIRWQGRELFVGLFPRECREPIELQGGESKRHTILLETGKGAEPKIASFQQPVHVAVDTSWIRSSMTVPYFISQSGATRYASDSYVHSIIEGPHSFFIKREIIDEFGWRNFGDTYADHEAIRSAESGPLISHYNNQYDFLLAAATHFLRSGDRRWRELMIDAARHTIDIDIYHTRLDRAAYSGGMFWHTDHYKDARTSTHRTYSRANSDGGSYGGGPSNEHNYTSGLLLYYLLTGDESASQAVCTLADWVVAMDDGTRSILSFLDNRCTGRASSTVSPDYHKPGRGAGNSINALLDAYTVSGQHCYLAKAEELICRCIHPADDIDAQGLTEPEFRWSYLVFLQVLGKFLQFKTEIGELDFMFFYARDSLLHYAAWMVENERPYKDVLHKVLLPTETWPAQDIRKCHIMHLAAMCSTDKARETYSEKADYFYDRCLGDLLEFDTAFLTRPQVIISVYGHVHAFFRENGYPDEQQSPYSATHKHTFARPTEFVRQRPIMTMLSTKGGGPFNLVVWDILSDKVLGKLRALRPTTRRAS